MDNLLQYLVQGLASGGFYAVSALGLAVIFGMLGVVNFAHGAFYMLGAVLSAILLRDAGLGFWACLVIVPVIMFVIGMIIERLIIQWLRDLDHLYNFLATFGLALILVDLVTMREPGGIPYPTSGILAEQVVIGPIDMPASQLIVLALALIVCAAVWFVLTRTKVGMIVRATTERPELCRALGINVGRWVTPVFGAGIALAGFAGVLAAPMRGVNAEMGTNFATVLFAVVVIGGLGSIAGAALGGFLIGLVEAFGQAYAPTYAYIMIFALMALVILARPSGLLGRREELV